ncbi:KxYKxGKxW signal peptide domain-containing protein, partial [Staphylococcus borealis]|uniref:lectin-like domain-containing protein n=1 Tax=Staphylococcus borealis TaxID=2742203 RepID=UPI002DB9B177
MSKKERNFKRSFGEEKARVKLYKSGKQWVKAGIKEIQLLKMLGLPFLNKDVEEISNLETNHNERLKKQAMRATGLVGGAFTFTMLNDHQAYAASETPMTSEISSTSATVANQQSTAITKSETSESTESTSKSTVESTSNKNSVETTSNKATSNANSSTSTTSTSEQEAPKSEAASSEKQIEKNSGNTSNSDKSKETSTSEEKKSSTNSLAKDTSTNSTSEKSNKTSSSSNKESLSNSNENNSKGSTRTEASLASNNAQKSVTSSTHTTESNKNEDLGSALFTTNSTSSSTSPTKLRTFSRLAVSTNNANVAVAQVDNNDFVSINKDNFTDHFNVKDSATFDASTGIVTLTPDANSKKGSITLNTKINSNKSFHFTGKVNLGNRYEGYSPGGVIGGDGIGFAFSPGKIDDTGKEGAALGIGGLNNAFGFKLDTYHNTSQPKADAKANKDPSNVAGGGAFGAFVSTDSSGVATTESTNAAKLKVQPTDNSFQNFEIDYNGDTKVMTVTYAGQQFTRNLSDWLKKNSNTSNYALSITASTGGARNLQQLQFGTFTYTQSASTEVRYVDATTGKDIIPPKTLAGDVDNVVTLDKQESAMNSLGYQYKSVDSSNAPTFNSTNNQVKLTNSGQSVIYYFSDVTAPTINMSNQNNQVFAPINPVTVIATDNSGVTPTVNVTGLPDGLTYDQTSNTISGTPTKIGNYTVTITASDSNNLRKTQNITWTITRNSTSDSISTSSSDSQSTSLTKSTSESTSIANSQSNSNSVSLSNFMSASTSTVESNSNSTSKSTSLSASASTSVSDSTSASTSDSASTSTSVSDSTSESTSDSASVSTSVSDSTSESTSESASTSTSVSDSTSTSTSLSGSESASLSDSLSESTSLSASASTSVSDSTSESTSLSESTSTSVSDSTSTSTSLSESESASLSDSLSESTSLSASASTSVSDSTSEST